MVVLPPVDATSARFRVLGEKRGGSEVGIVRLARAKIEQLRVGKLDHPALLYVLESEPYWPATTEAHQEVTRLVQTMTTHRDDPHT